MDPPASQSLEEALQRRGITLERDQLARIDRYCALLWDWNSKLNLTRHTDFDTFVSRDVVDSLRAGQAAVAWRGGTGRGQRWRCPGRPAGGAAWRPGRDDVRLHAEEGPRPGLHRKRTGVAGSRAPLPGGTVARRSAIRLGRGPCRRPALEDPQVVRAPLGIDRATAAGEGAEVGGRASRGAGTWFAQAPGTAAGRRVSAGRHLLRERDSPVGPSQRPGGCR